MESLIQERDEDMFYNFYLSTSLSSLELYRVLEAAFPAPTSFNYEESGTVLLAYAGFQCIFDANEPVDSFYVEQYGINYKIDLYMEGVSNYEGDMLYELYLFIAGILKRVEGDALLIVYGESPRIFRNRYETVLLPVQRNAPDVALAFEELQVPFRRGTEWEPDFFKR
jgi:hypothetical protein